MIILVNLKKVNVSEYDEVWAIVRSMKYAKEGVTQRAELSPSWDLFKWYRDKVEKGEWSQKVFDEEYAPRFMREMENAEARKALNELWKKDRAGMKIAIGCFCNNERTCHRSLIGKMLSKAGSNVVCEAEETLRKTLKALGSSGIRIANMVEQSEAEYHQRYNAEEREYYHTALWTFKTKSGLEVTIDTGRARVVTWSNGTLYSVEIGEELLAQLQQLASVMYLQEPENKFTLSEKLNGVIYDGLACGYEVEYEDDLRREQDARYEEEESWYDSNLDWKAVMRKGYDENWSAGAGEYVSRFERDVKARPNVVQRDDAPVIRATFEYTDAGREFAELQEKLKRIPAREAWARRGIPKDLEGRYDVEEPKALKAGVTIKWA